MAWVVAARAARCGNFFWRAASRSAVEREATLVEAIEATPLLPAVELVVFLTLLADGNTAFVFLKPREESFWARSVFVVAVLIFALVAALAVDPAAAAEYLTMSVTSSFKKLCDVSML